MLRALPGVGETIAPRDGVEGRMIGFVTWFSPGRREAIRAASSSWATCLVYLCPYLKKLARSHSGAHMVASPYPLSMRQIVAG